MRKGLEREANKTPSTHHNNTHTRPPRTERPVAKVTFTYPRAGAYQLIMSSRAVTVCHTSHGVLRPTHHHHHHPSPAPANNGFIVGKHNNHLARHQLRHHRHHHRLCGGGGGGGGSNKRQCPTTASASSSPSTTTSSSSFSTPASSNDQQGDLARWVVNAGGDIAAVRVGEGPRGRGLFAARPIAKVGRVQVDELV